MVPEIRQSRPVIHKTGGETTDQLAEKYATQMVGNVEIGWTKYLCDPSADKSWWDKFVEGFEELISLMVSLVNNVADAYNGVKATVISSLCGGIVHALPWYRLESM